MTESLFNPFEFEDVESSEIAIRNPIGEPTGATVVLMGPEHPRRKEIEFAIQKRARAKLVSAMSRGRNAIDQADPEEEDEQQTDMLAKCTVGWSGFAAEDGRPLEFSITAARKLYSTPKLRWLRNQLVEALGDRERFIKRSAVS